MDEKQKPSEMPRIDPTTGYPETVLPNFIGLSKDWPKTQSEAEWLIFMEGKRAGRAEAEQAQSLSQEAGREITDEEIRAIAEREVNPAYDENTQIITYVTKVVRAVLALSALSQEAVRNENEEAAKVCDEQAKMYAEEGLTELCLALAAAADAIRVLKREPNAAAHELEVETEFSMAKSGPKYEFEIDGEWPVKPAPAAPDVASMVKKLNGRAVYANSPDAAMMREAAALLAKLGQGESTDSLDGRRYRYLRNRTCGRQLGEPESCWLELRPRDLDLAIDAATLPPAPGASDE
jgi:hypothetical protein